MHPILFQVTDNFYIGTYGLMIALGLLAGVGLAVWRAKRAGLAADPVIDLTFAGVVSGFIGGRIAFVMVNWGDFLQAPGELLLARSGFVFLGGLLFAVGACAAYIRWKGLGFWRMADLMAPSIAIGHGFGRLGCHFAGCCFGGVCQEGGAACLSVPRITTAEGIVWPNAYYDHVIKNLVDVEATHSLPVWPVQLMEAGGLFLLAGALLLVSRRALPLGSLFSIYLISYAVLRFVLEFVRGDEERGLYFGGLLSTSQLLSVALLGLGLWTLAGALQGGNGRRQEEDDPAKRPAAPSEDRRAKKKRGR